MRKAMSAVASLAVLAVPAGAGTANAATIGEVSPRQSCYSVAKVTTPVYLDKSVRSRKVSTFKKGKSALANCGGETGGSHTACGVTNKYWLWLPEYAGYVMWGCVTLQTDV